MKPLPLLRSAIAAALALTFLIISARSRSDEPFTQSVIGARSEPVLAIADH